MGAKSHKKSETCACPPRAQRSCQIAGMHLADLLQRQFAEPETSWAIGTFGAIAEFHRNVDEPVAPSASGAVTARGDIDLCIDAAVHAVAWERLSSGDSWTHGIALCLTKDASAMSRRTTITEIGPDAGALRDENNSEVLFDLGIGAPHCDFYVRTADAVLLRALRSAVGCSVLQSRLLGEIAAMSPTRGPQGMIPCAAIFPASAVHDAHGRQKPFDSAKHETFQTLFSMYGDPTCIRAKHETIAAVRATKTPTDVLSYTRALRLVRRVALRQLAHTDGSSPALTAWRAAFDRSA